MFLPLCRVGKGRRIFATPLLFFLLVGFTGAAEAQRPEGFGPGGFGPPERGRGGPGGEQRKLVKQFDANENGWLDADEREKARLFLTQNPTPRGGPRGPAGRRGPEDARGPDDAAGPSNRGGDFGPPGFGPPGFGPPGFGPPGGGPPGMRGGDRPPASEGPKIDKRSVAPVQGELYDTSVLRTLFLDFDHADWESELEDFRGTDVDVAATLTVDGKVYPNVGIHFRGMSSYNMVPAGYKRSLNVSLDMADKNQRLLGYKTLNLNNNAGDESMMSSVLYAHIAKQLGVPAPQANFVRVVINGEYWGVYTNVQQFNKDFLRDHFPSDKGARWKVSGSPNGRGGLDYRGDDPASYQHPYEQKSGGKTATAKLIELCRVLDQTPTDELPDALERIVNVDGLLWFLALDNALINSDGYWIRASDYSIYLDEQDKFHFIPHDMNEAFRGAGGPGGRGPGGPGGRGPGGPGGRGPSGFDEGRWGPRAGDFADRRSGFGREPSSGNVSPLHLDPLIGMDAADKPLRSKVLAVPKYRRQYLANVRKIAEESLNWNQLAPFLASQVELINDSITLETRSLADYSAFRAAVNPNPPSPSANRDELRRGPGSMNLREFAEGRADYLRKVTQ